MNNQPPPFGDIDPAEFRQYGHLIVDWLAEYLEQPDAYPVLSQVQPGDLKTQLPPTPPEEAESLETIWQDFQHLILPGITHWNNPNFYAYFAISGSMPGILGELLTAGLNVNGMLWRTSPAATELEQVTLDWLRQLLGLPAGLDGTIMDTASMSSLMAIAAAREATNLDIRTKGMAGRPDLPHLRLYISDQTHSSVEKGAITLGIGQENVVKIPSDEFFRMDVAALETAVRQDITRGFRPFFVCATVGTTSSTSIDPVPAIADIAEHFGLWLHVDGAYGGIAAIVPEMQHILLGVERADSLVVNPHKWLFTPIDLSVFYTRHPHIVKEAFSLLPEYLRSSQTPEVKNLMDYGVQLGRRFRALKLWWVMRAFGAEGLAARIREHIRLAQLFAEWVEDSAVFERTAPTPFSTVCFRAHPAGLDDETQLEQLNETLMNRINATGKLFISHTKLNGRYTLRLAIGNIRTQEHHIQAAWKLLQEQWEEVNSKQ